MSAHDPTRRARIDDVAAAESESDSLVTLAVPPDQALGDALERVEEEHARAEYIDADEASRPERDALGQLRHVLHEYDETPASGLVVYVGDVDGELVEYVFDDLPAPVPEAELVRANAFDTDPLAASTHPAPTYGLLVVERGGAALGRFEGGGVEPIETLDSQVMGKTKAGGQSADRFERRREQQKESFFSDVAEAAERAFLGEDSPEAVVLGGTEVTADEFRRGEYLDHRLRDLLVEHTYAVEYASEQGLAQLAERARDDLDAAGTEAAREALDRLFAGLDREDEPVVYGRAETERALEYGAVETTLLAESLPVETVQELRDRTEGEGGDCLVVPTADERGTQFADAFGGVGALLRYPLADAGEADG
ncbi:MAG: Vms1/Ankzf1 family peptidyl-tRNA hydrolase [Haloarculaceae archaeon]